MSEKHYVIALGKGYDKEDIMNDLSRDTTLDDSVDSLIIPDRQVQLVNNRPSSKRLFEMALTDEEAQAMLNDPRVGGVDEPLVWDDDWLDYQKDGPGTFIREGTATTRNNWGMLRHIEATNGWGSNTTSDRVGVKYTGHLDGTGVDYVHQEGNVPRSDHQQWQDSNGVSRYQEFQWNTLPNCSGAGTHTYAVGYYSSHPTHCTGTACGKDYGWATGAKIYALGYLQMNQAYWFDAIKEFHKAKTPDPVTGVVRPTVVNASWGGKAYFTSITDIYFRGSSTGTTTQNRDYGMIGAFSDGSAGGTKFNYNKYGLAAEVEEMQDEGVHYIKSAGNQYQKIDVVGGRDYNNYITRSVVTDTTAIGVPIYYNRGAGNIGPDTLVVGNLDEGLYDPGSGAVEATKIGSEKGPRVDVWAAGTNIISARAGDNYGVYNSTGTSMSTPQIAGMTILLLQLNPGMTPAQVRTWWHNNAKTGLLFQGETDETTDVSAFFANDRSLMNGTNRVAYFPYSAHDPGGGAPGVT